GADELVQAASARAAASRPGPGVRPNRRRLEPHVRRAPTTDNALDRGTARTRAATPSATPNTSFPPREERASTRPPVRPNEGGGRRGTPGQAVRPQRETACRTR